MAGRKLGFRRPDEDAAQPPVSPRKMSAPAATTGGAAAGGGGRPSGETPVSPRAKVSLPSLLNPRLGRGATAPLAPAPPVEAPAMSGESSLPELAEAMRGLLLCPGGPTERRYSRLLAACDALVASASALLRCLKTARASLSSPLSLVSLTAACVAGARGAAAQLGANDRLAGQLLARLGSLAERVPLLQQHLSEAALSAALEQAVEVAVRVRQLKEGALLETALVSVDAEVGLLADCLFAAAPSASSVGLHEALAAAAAEMGRFVGQGKSVTRELRVLSFAPLAESAPELLKLARLACAEKKNEIAQGRAMHLAAIFSALFRIRLAILEEGGDEEALRTKMGEAEHAVSSLLAASGGTAAVAGTSGSSGTAAESPVPARSKGFTLLRRDFKSDAAAAAENAAAGENSDWVAAGYEPRGTSAVFYLISQLAPRVSEIRGAQVGPVDLSIVGAVESRANLSLFSAEALLSMVFHFFSRAGPVFSAGASRCARQLVTARNDDADYRDLGLHFCVLSLAEKKRELFWQTVGEILRPLAARHGASAVAHVWEKSIVGGGGGDDSGGECVLLYFLSIEERVSGAAGRGAEEFRMAGSVVGCANLSFVAELIVREEYKLVEPRILEVVLMTHTIWCRSAQLLSALLSLYEKNRIPSKDNLRKIIRNRVVDAIGFWFMSPVYLNNLSEDFVAVWQSFLSSLIAAGIRETEKNTFKKFTLLLSSHFTRLENQMEGKNNAETTTPTTMTDLDGYRHRLQAEEIRVFAESVTRCDWALFSRVQPHELLSNNHMAEESSPNFSRMILHFNTLNTWVAHSVLAPDSSSHDRAALLSFFVALAKALYDLNNFHSSYAVLCGLHGSAVARLGKSFRRLPKKGRATLEELMEANSHTKNYKRYREHLRACRPPVVPQIGILSRDLFGLEENNSDMVEKRFVNLEKSRVLEKVAHDVLALQSTPFVFVSSPDDPLVAFFRNLPAAVARAGVTEKVLYDRSLALEPRLEQPAEK